MACGCRGSGAKAAPGSTVEKGVRQQGGLVTPRTGTGTTWNGPRRKTGDTGLSSAPIPPRRPA